MAYYHNNNNIHFIGIKGSGMCALALLLQKLGNTISGSDIADTFYTDSLLINAAIPCSLGFSTQNLQTSIDLIIYSAAYTAENNEELRTALTKYTCLSYPQALGMLSKELPACAVIGTHGKTSTTALAGTIVKALQFPVMTITGGKVADWNNNTMWYGGDTSLIAEVCEYRNHFAYFNANYAVFTSAEHDHPDYFANKEAVVSTFTHFINGLANPKILIACVDDSGVRECLSKICKDIQVIMYGDMHAITDTKDNISSNKSVILKSHRIVYHKNGKATQQFTIQGLSPTADSLQWELPVPGKALVYNAIAALILTRELYSNTDVTVLEKKEIPDIVDWTQARNALSSFRGISRRCELIYQDTHYTIIDDYAHHPTAIAMTLEGIRKFYRPKRLIVDFMPHTFTRSAALLDDFSTAFGSADLLLIQNIYGSAREMQQYTNAVRDGNLPNIDGKKFVEAINVVQNNVYYMPDFTSAIRWITDNLLPGDLVVTMGAGDNFRIAETLAQSLQSNNS